MIARPFTDCVQKQPGNKFHILQAHPSKDPGYHNRRQSYCGAAAEFIDVPASKLGLLDD